MAAGETYLSRFFVKFIEISAAGVATAVSGYVLAHLTGYLNGPTAMQSPASLQAPVRSPVRVAAPVAVPPAPVAAPPASPPPVASAPATPPARAATITPAQQEAKSAPLRKSLPADKPADTANAANATESKVRDVTDTKPHSADAIAAEVRAALAKVDAAHPAKADAKADAKIEVKPEAAARRPDNSAEIAARTPAADSKSRPVESPTGAIAAPARPDAPPRAADAAPPQPSAQPAPPSSPPPQFASQHQFAPQPVSQPGPQAPMQIAPPTTTVEIKSMPVAGVDPAPQSTPQADAQAQPTDGGIFSAFSRKLRDDKPLPADQAPRPPADVGQ